MTYCNELLESEQHITESISGRGSYLFKETDSFSVKIYVDFFNQRIKVLNYIINDYDLFSQYLDFILIKYRLGKIIMVAGESDWQPLFSRGFCLEALHPTFFSGKPGYHLSKFSSAERRNSLHWDAAENILKQVRQLSAQYKPLPMDYQIRTADIGDIPQLVSLYSSVFHSYPTPMDDPQYIEKAIHTNMHFKIVLAQGKIASAASLDLDMDTNSAELTDCATLPDYRGQSLMSHLVSHLEVAARSIGLTTVYTIARATSFGINAIFFRHGYSYYGRFINNCDICGRFEDMNLWSKKL